MSKKYLLINMFNVCAIPRRIEACLPVNFRVRVVFTFFFFFFMAEQLKTEKRSIEESEAPTKKKQKLDTIPILRGRFKQRWLTKHSSLLKRSDESTGILISCNVNAETRALGQVTNCLETYITKLFPDHQSTWIRFEGPYDIDEVDQEECEEEGEKEKKEDKAERKERKFQAVDAACGGLVFFRFRVNVKPTEFVLKFMGI